MKVVLKLLVKVCAVIHTVMYKIISRLVVRLEGGLHPKHRIMDYHKFFVDNISSGDSVVDIGCGNGALACDLAGKANKVLGIDINSQNIARADKCFCGDNVKYIIEDAVKYDFTETFDVAVLSNVLEHIADRESLLKKIQDLTPKILIRVPLLDRDWLVLYKKELGLEYRLDKTHEIEYTEKTFLNEMDKAGLKVDNLEVRFGEIYAVVRSK